jgi:hypothetical protein
MPSESDWAWITPAITTMRIVESSARMGLTNSTDSRINKRYGFLALRVLVVEFLRLF